MVVLKKKLEEALGDLTEAKGERDRYMEKMQSLLCEVEALDQKREETQVPLDQGENCSRHLSTNSCSRPKLSKSWNCHFLSVPTVAHD